MKLLIVTMGIAPESGGPTRSCKGLCRALSQAGVDVTLYVLHGRHSFENPCGVKVVYASDATTLPVPLCLCVKNYDLVHLQGLWDPALHEIASACRKQHVPYIVSPRGMLDPWALSVKKWKKRLAMWLYQKRDLKGAVAFHVTAEMERDHVRALGFTQPCIIAPNGVILPVDANFCSRPVDAAPSPRPNENQLSSTSPSATSPSSLLTSHSSPHLPRTAIFLSRIHPGKGLMTLAEAWARVKPQGWRMLIVGPDNYGHKAEVVSKLDALKIPHANTTTDLLLSSPSPLVFTSSQWVFIDQVDDVEKWKLYRSAEILIHPSVSENFGITIAEALYAGLPAIATKGTPWKDLEDHHCGLWIDQGVDALASALSNLLSLQPSKLRALGANGHKLILEKYTWPAIAGLMISGYKSVLNKKVDV